MATRGGGPTVSGTDGDDYLHREQIVKQYYIRPPPQSQPKGMGYSDDENDPSGMRSHSPLRPSSYPDTQDFIAQFMKIPEDPNPAYPLPPQSPSSLNTPPVVGQTLPNGMVMVPANQMMMLAPQWMFPGAAAPPQQPVHLSPPTPEPSLTPEPPLTPIKKELTPARPLANHSDYKGLGGPDTVPFRMTRHDSSNANTTPFSQKKKTLVDELFISPTEDLRVRASRTVLNMEISQTKTRLKWSVLFHYALGFILLAKFLPDALDKLGIFVLEIEELLIPKAKLWELCWIVSIPVTFLGLASCKRSNASMMTSFFYGILIFGLFPALVGLVSNFSDLYTYASTKDLEQVETWNGYPVAVLWYFYLFMSLQAHLFELYFAKTLIKAWQPGKKKAQ